MLRKCLKWLLGGSLLAACLSGCTVDSWRIERFADDVDAYGCYYNYVGWDAYDYEAFYGDPDALWMDCGGCDGFFFYDYHHSTVWAKDVYRKYVRYFDAWRVDHSYVEESYGNTEYFEMVVEGTFYSIRRVGDTILFYSGHPGCAGVVDDVTRWTGYDR